MLTIPSALERRGRAGREQGVHMRGQLDLPGLFYIQEPLVISIQMKCFSEMDLGTF